MMRERPMPARAYLIRHGDTEWSTSGRHTGSTEIPLSQEGESRARMLAPHLAGVKFDLVLVSPRHRAWQTCELAGLGARAQTDAELAEWNYGDYEGLKSAEILQGRPDWCLFRDGCPGGESPEQVAARADRVIERIRSLEGRVALFSHGHFGRVLGTRWINLPVIEGRKLLLDPATLSILGYEHDKASNPVLELWNYPPTGEPQA
jgi:broad specificity phosphatase PhoE